MWLLLQQARLPALLAEQNTKLVVLDSVAAVFRLESTSSVKVFLGLCLISSTVDVYETEAYCCVHLTATGGGGTLAHHVPYGQLHAHPERPVRRRVHSDQPSDGRL